MTFTEQAEKEGIISFDADRKYITYIHQSKKRNYGNAEEKVQAEVFSKLVLEYKYPVEHIQQFVPVKMGSSTREADLVVYQDKAQNKPWIVIECKHEDASQLEFEEAEKQAFSYANAIAGTTKFIWVTKGNQDAFYKFDKESNKRETDNNIPYFGEDDTNRFRYAKKGFYWDKKGGKKIKVPVSELQPIQESDLTRIFKQAHDALWAGGELNPNQAFDELDKLVFCKIWDEKKTPNGEPYHFQVYKGEAVETLKKRILAIYEKGKREDPDVFNKPIDLTPERIKTIVEFFQKINLTKTDLDSKGKAFETFIGTYFRGEFGQYFTPRNVVKFIVDVLPINNESLVLDTSCGSGGFLLYALDKVRRQATSIYPDYETDLDDRDAWKEHWHSFASKKLFGIEINDQISRVAKMNMIIHDDGHTNVVTYDGLFDIDIIAEKTGNKGFKENSFDFIITNPPFGSIVKQSEKSYMRMDGNTAPYYSFALKEINWIDEKLKKHHKAASRPNQNTEILFLEQCHKFLKPNGYVAVVIPDGILTNSSLQYVRNSIEELFRIVAVISLPQTTFTHTGAGVKSSVLFLRKYDDATTKELKEINIQLQDKVATQTNLVTTINSWEHEKKQRLKPLKAKDAPTKIRRSAISSEYNEKIKDFKDDVETQLLKIKQEQLGDYSIFMALVDNIGYDAVGKNSNQLLAKSSFVGVDKNGNNKNFTKEFVRNDLFELELIKSKIINGNKLEEVVVKEKVIPHKGISGELKRFINAIENGTDANFQ